MGTVTVSLSLTHVGSTKFHKEAAAGKSFSVHVYLDTRLDAFEGARECAKITRNNHKLFLDHVYLEVLLDVSYFFWQHLMNTWIFFKSRQIQ